MSSEPASAFSPLPIFVDTDAGCDDALAIAWLLNQPAVRIVGFSTVHGNTTVQNTTANVLSLLEASGSNSPVTIGASTPLAYPRTGAGALAHGPDGMWGAGSSQALDGLPDDAPNAIATAARANPGLVILALGPLTNIARAVQAFPDDLAGVRLVALGGADHGGNITPTAEFNIFADPHALAVVLESRVRLELVTLDAFNQLVVDPAILAADLAREGGRVGAILGHALFGYSAALTRGQGGPIPIPDASAAIYALFPQLGTASPATVRVVVDGELTRGQTVIATSFNHRIAIGLGAGGTARLAELVAGGANLDALLGEALHRANPNALVILQIDGSTMADLLVAGLLGRDISRAVGT